MAINICAMCGCLYEAKRNWNKGYCKSCKPKADRINNERHLERMRFKRNFERYKKANRLIYDALRQLEQYNAENGTHLSYGQFVGKGYITNPPKPKAKNKAK